MRSFSRLPYRTSTLLRALHSSPIRSARQRDERGNPLYTVEEFLNNYRRGYENAGGNWKESENKMNNAGQYSEADLKAALEKGMEEADKYIGAAIRGAWDGGFTQGKIEGISEEQKESERNIREEQARFTAVLREQMDTARKIGFTEGLSNHPDYVKAKQEGRAESEKEASQRAEKKADEKISKILQEATAKEKNSKERIIAEYLDSKKLTTRLMKRYHAFMGWKKTVALTSFFASDQFTKVLSLIKNIPLTPFKQYIYRPWVHGNPSKQVKGWGPNHRNSRWDDSFRTLYRSTLDRIRLQDLYGCKVINMNNQEYEEHESASFGIIPRILLFYGIPAFIAWYVMNLYDAYLHGETLEQQASRQKVEKACAGLDTVKVNLTDEEAKELKQCKTNCQDAKQHHDQMRLEMQARRASGYGDRWHFDYRNEGRQSFTLDSILRFEKSIETRLKKQKYEEILASGQSGKGFRG